MPYEFTETLTITVPDIEEQVAAFLETEYKTNHGLIIEVAAIHEGMTANFNYYPSDVLTEALESWIAPYPKPIIMNHDSCSEPVGRVMAAKMDKESDGTPYVRLQVAITDPEAIAKVMDQRYLTGSVGGKADEAVCNICGADWANASMFSMPCKHRRGAPYKGKIACIEMRKVQFKEYSFVNMPADQRSSVRSLGTAATESESDGWVRAARVFSLDMRNEEIVEFTESENRSVLAGMKKKDASPMYHQIRGAFLSALAVAESDDEAKTEKESNVTEPVLEDEDVLAVAEELSADLTRTEPEEEASEETEETEETEEAEEPEEELAADETESTDEEVEEEEEVSEEQEEQTEDSEETDSQEEEADETQVDETDLNEQVQALESRVAELEAREQSLLEENTRLKTALKRGLAERVVDTKIALGLHDAEQRAELLEEHAQRSASSLADSLRDLAAMPGKVRETRIPQIVEESAAVEDGEKVTTDGEPATKEKTVIPEDFFTDVLMGRRVL